MRTVNIILAVLFTLFALVQINDPDPLKWILIYASIAAINVMAYLGKLNRWIILGFLALFVIETIIMFPDFMDWINMGMPTITGTMKAETEYVELTREFLGIVICVWALIFNYFQAARQLAQ